MSGHPSEMKTDRASGLHDWEKWLEDHSSSLLLYARHQCRLESEAEDVLQDALVHVWKFWVKGQLQDEDRVKAAIIRIRRGAIDRYRSFCRRQRREGVSIEDVHSISSEWFDADPARRECMEHLVKALDSIDARYREVIVLKIWGHLTFQQIAEVLGYSQNSVTSLYRYGLEKIRIQLDEAPIPDIRNK